MWKYFELEIQIVFVSVLVSTFLIIYLFADLKKVEHKLNHHQKIGLK